MIIDEREFYALARVLPGRLTVEQTAWLLGFNPNTIPIIVAAKIGLSPLGKPGVNSPKYFSATEVERLRQDRQFLDKASAVIHGHWRTKRAGHNGKRSRNQLPDGRIDGRRRQNAGQGSPNDEDAMS